MYVPNRYIINYPRGGGGGSATASKVKVICSTYVASLFSFSYSFSLFSGMQMHLCSTLKMYAKCLEANGVA